MITRSPYYYHLRSHETPAKIALFLMHHLGLYSRQEHAITNATLLKVKTRRKLEVTV